MDKETVGCSACAKRIVINMKKEDSVAEEEESTASLIDQHTWQWNARKELAARYALMIVSGHYEDCLWRTRGCDGMFESYAWSQKLTLQKLPYNGFPPFIELQPFKL